MVSPIGLNDRPASGSGHNDSSLDPCRLLGSKQQQWHGRRQGQSDEDRRQCQCEEDLADEMRHHLGSPVSGPKHAAAAGAHVMPLSTHHRCDVGYR